MFVLPSYIEKTIRMHTKNTSSVDELTHLLALMISAAFSPIPYIVA
jgi:hypothetical protein